MKAFRPNRFSPNAVAIIQRCRVAQTSRAIAALPKDIVYREKVLELLISHKVNLKDSTVGVASRDKNQDSDETAKV
jgi:hypothetical protein